MEDLLVLEIMWKMKSADGTAVSFPIRLFRPENHQGHATCRVQVGDDIKNIFGVDAWHSVRVAMDFAKKVTLRYEEMGMAFERESGEPVGSGAL